MKKQLMIGVVLVIIFLGIGGCIEETEEENTINESLNNLVLTLGDLQGAYNKYDEEYVTEPYTVQTGLLLEGWMVLEKYEVRFSKNDSNFILQTLARLESKEKCKEFIDKIESLNMSYTFLKEEMNIIGEGSFIGKNTTTIFDDEVELYFLCFRIDDVIVVFLSSDISKEDIINHAKVVENNINKVITNE